MRLILGKRKFEWNLEMLLKRYGKLKAQDKFITEEEYQRMVKGTSDMPSGDYSWSNKLYWLEDNNLRITFYFDPFEGEELQIIDKKAGLLLYFVQYDDNINLKWRVEHSDPWIEYFRQLWLPFKPREDVIPDRIERKRELSDMPF